MSTNDVGQIFITASVAFAKLGNMTKKLKKNPVGHGQVTWTNEDIKKLHNIITKFSDNLDKVQESVRKRTEDQGKAAIDTHNKTMNDDMQPLPPGDLTKEDAPVVNENEITISDPEPAPELVPDGPDPKNPEAEIVIDTSGGLADIEMNDAPSAPSLDVDSKDD